MNNRKAFTLVELLVVISIIALLVGILLPALSRARDAAMINTAKNNIRNVYMANANYNSEWKGNQFVGAPSDLAKYGDTLSTAIQGYLDNMSAYGDEAGGGWSPGPGVQFGETNTGQVWFCGNVQVYIAPYCWGSGPTSATQAPRHGTFLYPNTRQIAEYMEDSIVNKAYFSPKDSIVLDALKECMSSEGNLCPGDNNYGGYSGDYATFGISKFGGYSFPPFIPPSSYCYSPANMVNPDVYDVDASESGTNNGFRDPCTFNTGFRAPTLDQSRYPSLKSYLMEHHWLQNVTGEACHPRWDAAQYDYRHTSNDGSGWHWGGCYPSLAVHSFRSVPVTCFNDGHIGMMDINSCDKADNIVLNANSDEYGVATGTWHRFTHDGDSGYWLEAGTDWMDVCPHTHTAFGSNGRDITADVAGN